MSESKDSEGNEESHAESTDEGGYLFDAAEGDAVTFEYEGKAEHLPPTARRLNGAEGHVTDVGSTEAFGSISVEYALLDFDDIRVMVSTDDGKNCTVTADRSDAEMHCSVERFTVVSE